MAIRWVLEQPQVAAAIVGARYASNLSRTLEVFRFELTSKDKTEIDTLLKKASGPSGPVYGIESDRTSKHGRIMKYNLNNTHTIGLQMNVHFCERCDNLTGIYIKEEDNTLIHHCSSCNLSYPFEPEERCIYKIEFGEKDKSLALNENK